ncbi:MAG: monovalent cation/H+ antiporter subunit D [Thiotrichales bacterium 35-46-9]|nr:MAG: monovalent cation/H+ antiporter subunit D [Thiotrichales bacterium 35-46-9]
MMSLTITPVLLPLIAGFSLLLLRQQSLAVQRLFSLGFILALVMIALNLVSTAASGEHQVYLAGNWMAPFGIVFVLDQLSALMVLLTALLALAAMTYTIAHKIDELGAHFHVLFQLQLFGLNGAFMTGDVFNLFVFFEVLLLASYGLLLHGGGRLRTKAGLHYVVINLIGSTLFLFAVGALYGAVGTLNLADMADKIAQAPEERHGLIASAGLLLLIVFGLKAAMFPLYLWLPAAYSQTSAPVAIIRVHGTLFGEAAGPLAYLHIDWVLVSGLITLVLAALAVIAAKGLREQVAYLVLASVATLLIGIGLNRDGSLAATLFYLVHSTLIAAALFLLADTISRGRGDFADKFVSAPAIPQAIFIGAVFMFAAIAMTGMPPLSGFFGKLALLNSALTHPWIFTIFAVVLLSSLLLIIAMARAGSLLFYRTQPTTESVTTPPNRLALSAVLALLSVAALMVVFANPMHEWTQSIAQQQLAHSTYLNAVLSTPVITREVSP